MKRGNWIPLHTNVRYWLPKTRKYNELEALISYTLDIDSSTSWSINGYARLWGWSRNKVRRFIDELGTIERTGKGHLLDRQRTVSGQEVSLKIKDLENSKDKQRTGKGQAKDRQRYTTIQKHNHNHIKEKEIRHRYGEYKHVFLTYEQYEKLRIKFNGKHEEKIKLLDEGIEQHGYKYKNHYLAILKWAEKDKKTLNTEFYIPPEKKKELILEKSKAINHQKFVMKQYHGNNQRQKECMTVIEQLESEINELEGK